MKKLKTLFENNRRWAEKLKNNDPEFFTKLLKQQAPEYLWIGCSDSRVPANEIVGLMPGELFVHRNVANLVVENDLNCLSVLQFAVDVLKVKHIIVCGHYGCGGVKAAINNERLGIADKWLRHIKIIYEQNKMTLSKIANENKLINTLCEMNVREQVLNVSKTSIVQDAWKRKQELNVHGWIYDISDGLLQDLEVSISNNKELSLKFTRQSGKN